MIASGTISMDAATLLRRMVEAKLACNVAPTHPVVPEPAKLRRLRDEPGHVWAEDWSSSRAWAV